MLLTPLFFILYELADQAAAPGRADRRPEADDVDEQGPIIIAGIGRFGQVVNRMLQIERLRRHGVWTTIWTTIQLMRRFGFNGFLRRSDPAGAAARRRAGPAPGCWWWRWTTRTPRTPVVRYARKRAARPAHRRARPRPGACLRALPGRRQRHRARDVRQLAARRRATCWKTWGSPNSRRPNLEKLFYQASTAARCCELARTVGCRACRWPTTRPTSPARASWTRSWRPRCCATSSDEQRGARQPAESAQRG